MFLRNHLCKSLIVVPLNDAATNVTKYSVIILIDNRIVRFPVYSLLKRTYFMDTAFRVEQFYKIPIMFDGFREPVVEVVVQRWGTR